MGTHKAVKILRDSKHALGPIRHLGTRAFGHLEGTSALRHFSTCGAFFNKLVNFISSYYATLLSNQVVPLRKHSSLYNMFSFIFVLGRQSILPPSSLIHLWSNWIQIIFPWEVLRSWNYVSVIRKNRIGSTDVSASLENLRMNRLVIFCTTNYFLDSWKIPRKLSITTVISVNVVGATFLKSFSLMDTFIGMHK